MDSCYRSESVRTRQKFEIEAEINSALGSNRPTDGFGIE